MHLLDVSTCINQHLFLFQHQRHLFLISLFFLWYTEEFIFNSEQELEKIKKVILPGD